VDDNTGVSMYESDDIIRCAVLRALSTARPMTPASSLHVAAIMSAPMAASYEGLHFRSLSMPPDDEEACCNHVRQYGMQRISCTAILRVPSLGLVQVFV